MTAHDDNAARMCRTGYYNAYDGKGWQKCAEGLPVWEGNLRDKEARGVEYWRRSLSTGEARFVAGQTISTLEEYEALPIGTSLWPAIDGPGGWEREAGGYRHSETMSLVPAIEMLGGARVIRSLP